jgi:glycerol-3-phosphate acyltransferase PlsY
VFGYALFTATGVIPFHWAVLGFILVASAIITWRHRPNIERILRGAEPRLGSRSRP